MRPWEMSWQTNGCKFISPVTVSIHLSLFAETRKTTGLVLLSSPAPIKPMHLMGTCLPYFPKPSRVYVWSRVCAAFWSVHAERDLFVQGSILPICRWGAVPLS